ncbi:TPA: hypothetical protein O4S93_002645 [Staphylococcus aureus]|nr:hypothetical protein [Staphylococcus aureus]
MSCKLHIFFNQILGIVKHIIAKNIVIIIPKNNAIPKHTFNGTRKKVINFIPNVATKTVKGTENKK